MKVPHCRVRTVGEFTDWGKRFINHLDENQLVEISPVESINNLLENQNQAMSIVLLENTKDSQSLIEQIRASSQRIFILWVGRIFSQEDLHFALQHRIFWVFENSRPDDESVAQGFVKLSVHIEKEKNIELIIRSMKSSLLQAEGDIAPAVMADLRTAVSRMAEIIVMDDFAFGPAVTQHHDNSKMLIHASETLKDVLTTIDNLDRTGVLWIRGAQPGQEGRIEFLTGRIGSAYAGEVRGSKAVYRMFLWDSPKFMFARRDPDEISVDQRFYDSIKHLNVEGEAYKNRYEKIRKELPPPEIELELDPSYLHSGAEIEEDEFHTLASVIEFGKVYQVIDYNELPDTVLYDGLISLRKKNIIRIAS